MERVEEIFAKKGRYKNSVSNEIYELSLSRNISRTIFIDSCQSHFPLEITHTIYLYK